MPFLKRKVNSNPKKIAICRVLQLWNILIRTQNSSYCYSVRKGSRIIFSFSPNIQRAPQCLYKRFFCYFMIIFGKTVDKSSALCYIIYVWEYIL